MNKSFSPISEVEDTQRDSPEAITLLSDASNSDLASLSQVEEEDFIEISSPPTDTTLQKMKTIMTSPPLNTPRAGALRRVSYSAESTAIGTKSQVGTNSVTQRIVTTIPGRISSHQANRSLPLPKDIPTTTRTRPMDVSSAHGRREQKIRTDLSMSSAHQIENVPKYNQHEMNIAVGSKVLELNEAHDKALSEISGRYLAQIDALSTELNNERVELSQIQESASIEDENAARQMEAKEAEMKRRLDLAEKSFTETSSRLDLVTNELMNVKSRREETNKIQYEVISVLEGRMRAFSAQMAVKDEAIKQVQAEFETFGTLESSKRAKAVLKCKEDMKALAQEQFQSGSTEYWVVKNRLDEVMIELNAAKSAKERTFAEKFRLMDELRRAQNNAKVASSEVNAAETVLSTKERERLDEVRVLLNKSKQVQGQLDAMNRAKDVAVSERDSLQLRINECAEKERFLLEKNNELRRASGSILGVLDSRRT